MWFVLTVGRPKVGVHHTGLTFRDVPTFQKSCIPVIDGHDVVGQASFAPAHKVVHKLLILHQVVMETQLLQQALDLSLCDLQTCF